MLLEFAFAYLGSFVQILSLTPISEAHWDLAVYLPHSKTVRFPESWLSILSMDSNSTSQE